MRNKFFSSLLIILLSLCGLVESRLVRGQANQAAGTAPATRNRPALAYDAARKHTVIFGGAVKTKSTPDVWEWQTDTWGWDGKQWQMLSEEGPSTRALPSIAYDSRRKRLVLFGGQHNDAALGDTWEWDGSNWKRGN